MAVRTPFQTEQRRDLLVGLILLAFAIAWTVTVYLTIPAGKFGVGPRAFPFWLGAALIVLSGIMVFTAWRRRNGSGAAPEPSGLAGAGWPLVKTVFWVCLIIIGYGYLMETAGFVLATAITVAFALWVVLRERRPLVVLAMAVGITAGCWLAFGQILGAHLPSGPWSLF